MRSLLLFLLLFCGCGGPPPPPSSYAIGIDPTWYPLEIEGREKSVLAFSIELLTAIAREEELELSVVHANWNDLTWGLRHGQYSAMLSTKRPYAFYLKEFSFSPPYLLTGPVIVLPKTSPSDDITGKEIGVIKGSSAALILQTTPQILLQGYDSVPDLFDALGAGQIDGAAVEILTATSYLRNFHPQTLRIASAPLNDMGLRLVSMHHQMPQLMERFDRGLESLKKSGAYDKLIDKWGLASTAYR